jgi:hypothetical protein
LLRFYSDTESCYGSRQSLLPSAAWARNASTCGEPLQASQYCSTELKAEGFHGRSEAPANGEVKTRQAIKT